MPGKKENGGAYVTKTQCRQEMRPLRDDVRTIKDALLGKDLRSGLVLQVTEFKNKLEQVIKQKQDEQETFKEEQRQHKQTIARLKIATVAFGFTLVGIIINHLWH